MTSCDAYALTTSLSLKGYTKTGKIAGTVAGTTCTFGAALAANTPYVVVVNVVKA